MASALPPFAPFGSGGETWEGFMERFECYLIASKNHNQPEEEKCSFFLSCCGPAMFVSARALAAPRPAYTLGWDTLMARLKGHYAPAPSRIARCFAFHRRVQKPMESISQFLESLHVTAAQCDFQNLDENLVEQFVCGVRDIHLRSRMFRHHDITLQQAVEAARAAELSEQSTANIECLQLASPLLAPMPGCPPSASQACLVDELLPPEDPSNEVVGQLRAQPRRPPPPPPPPAASTASGCIGCGGRHARTACPFKNTTCHRCNKKGHIAQVCRASLPAPSFLQQPAASQAQPHRQSPRPARRAEDCHTVYLPEVTGETVSQASAGARKVLASLHLEGQPCRMEVDSGSSRSLISWAAFSHLCPHISCAQLLPVDTSLRDYKGTLIPTLGSFPILVDYGTFHGRLPILIVKNSLPALLGLHWFPPLGLSIGGVHRVVPSSLEDVLLEFSDVFDSQLGSYRGTPISLNLNPQVAPIRLKARRMPFALRAKVDTELDKLLAQGVLKPVDHSRWETPILVPVKPDGSVRICAKRAKDHPGIARMKVLARSYVWWPLLDTEIAAYVGRCTMCQLSRPNPPSGPAREWEAPRGPWSRLHIDYAGPFHGQNFLIMVDAYSRWVELVIMTSTTAESTVRALRQLFATHGLPDVLVSDNGPQFTSTTFQEFLAEQGIRHAPTAPYHPACSGRAERAVRSAKEALGRMDQGDWQARVAAYLLSQHSTPCPTTNKSPAELLMGRRLRIPLDRLHPLYSGDQPCNLGVSPPRSFRLGDLVWARSFAGEPKWVAAVINSMTSPCSYRVGLANGSEWRRHLDQLRRRLPMETSGPKDPGPNSTAAFQPVPTSQAFPHPGLAYPVLPECNAQADPTHLEWAFPKSGPAYPSAPCWQAPLPSQTATGIPPIYIPPFVTAPRQLDNPITAAPHRPGLPSSLSPPSGQSKDGDTRSSTPFGEELP
ncbi:PREDICTED: uncharacterized protein LOC106542174 [Thamnophis sirtalis]|uniref:Gypsy retrotransposon integrase-like protein 1 n=1 Tax=Thamnophis sirtalis TaxID=35019 RepID=A0A6I9XCI9_9SAUR|nr:PREDICTED: uncharacterized protein LOC106542174 [Thamnophis sirtalis]